MFIIRKELPFRTNAKVFPAVCGAVSVGAEVQVGFMEFQSEVRNDAFGKVNVKLRSLVRFISGLLDMVYKNRKLIGNKRIINSECSGEKPLACNTVGQ